MALALHWADETRLHLAESRRYRSLGALLELAGPDPARVPGSVASAAFGKHWVRDAAFVVQGLTQADGLEPLQQQEIERIVHRYVLFSEELQNLKPPRENYDKRQGQMSYARYVAEKHTIGEAVFQTQGVYFEPAEKYGFIQLDGPALRSLFLLRHAQAVVGRAASYPAWTTMWSVIFADLHYLCHNWRQPCWDVWGETWGLHWFTLMAIRQLMREAAVWAVDGDCPVALHAAWRRHWSETSYEIEQELRSFIVNGRPVPTRTPTLSPP